MSSKPKKRQQSKPRNEMLKENIIANKGGPHHEKDRKISRTKEKERIRNAVNDDYDTEWWWTTIMILRVEV